MATNFTFTGLYRRDTIPINVVASRKTTGGVVNPVNLTLAVLYFTAKNAVTDSDAQAVFQKSISSGIQVTDATNGKFTVTIAPVDTDSLPFQEVTLECDIELIEVDGTTTTIARGQLVFEPDVTRAVS